MRDFYNGTGPFVDEVGVYLTDEERAWIDSFRPMGAAEVVRRCIELVAWAKLNDPSPRCAPAATSKTRQFSFRISEEQIELVERARGNLSKARFYAFALRTVRASMPDTPSS